MKKSFKKLALQKQVVSKLIEAQINGGVAGSYTSALCNYEYSKDYGNGCFDDKA
ncbi:hypothetical protein U8527_17635 [Kordia algicida OT-1]|uniref:Uncharacterized protein n=1 Tax=Kordia algicida OT-1 TaxID=391587 RepID=A9E3I2_9FLAO|nr:hypothetical protein [Kordia algicida]EDP95514.1 hypothetical protein KAOT1_11341 [Kordia algicida OT-1]